MTAGRSAPTPSPRLQNALCEPERSSILAQQTDEQESTFTFLSGTQSPDRRGVVRSIRAVALVTLMGMSGCDLGENDSSEDAAPGDFDNSNNPENSEDSDNSENSDDSDNSEDSDDSDNSENSGDGGQGFDANFRIPKTELFAPLLSSYGIFQAPLAGLQPAPNAQLVELSSKLFSSYSYKQRLLVLPTGTRIQVQADGELIFPEGTILTKTFYYPLDMRQINGPRRIMETRLMIRRGGQWNMAAYRWNEAQTDAQLLLEGAKTPVTWIDAQGNSKSTNYEIPHEGQCVTCHQSDDKLRPLGFRVPNTNRMVLRDGTNQNQLAYLAAKGLIDQRDWATMPSLPSYDDVNVALADRARAYMEVNCSHCHHPGGWERSARQGYDFRFTTPLENTEILDEPEEIEEELDEGDMPFLGTSLKHKEGAALVIEWLDTLP